MNPASRPAEDRFEREEHLPEHYITAQASLVERPLRALKQENAFAVLDAYGDMGTEPGRAEGLFYNDTRYLSKFEMRLEGRRPLLLGSAIDDDNAALTVDLTNPDSQAGDVHVHLPRDIIYIVRTKFLWSGACYERIGFRNFDTQKRRFRIDFLFDADFRDLFEVRGAGRPRRGHVSTAETGADRTGFRYDGLDGVARRSRLVFEPRPGRLEPNRASFVITLEPRQRTSILVRTEFEEGSRKAAPNFLTAFRDVRRQIRATTAGIATIESSNALFNEVICRSTSDLSMLLTNTEDGPYPYAGIPWYSTVFGRDGIITAMMKLWIEPKIAAGVLKYLAQTQATEFDPAADAEPGKILHERRLGEMARTGEVPFRRYYGTVDATPLFVMLAGMYFERTGDKALLQAIWPNIQAALEWCDRFGDRDGDGFLEYFRETEEGLANQGWKDSHDSVFHADGSAADGPIALCEAQAYLFAARRYAATIAAAIGRADESERLSEAAEALRLRFEEQFWCEDLGIYALALDGAKRPCRVVTSNAGHALFAGIASPERAARVADTLMTPDNFTGWGVRTLSRAEKRFNPMSYHNGSIWPHDNALLGCGFGRYGLKAHATRVFEAVFEAAIYQEERRLPELYCGFMRKRHRGPVAYPVACSPQAWAAASPFALLRACLGLELRHARDEIAFINPTLPRFMDAILIRRLRLGESEVNLRLVRHGSDVTVNVLDRRGPARIHVSQ